MTQTRSIMPRSFAPVLTPIAASLLIASLTGCVSIRETQPAHTATEELLVSHAAEIAADKLATALPLDRTVYIDASHFKGDTSDYALSAVRAAFLRHGMVLTDDKPKAELIVELRLGALSIDQSDTVFGLPAGYLPIPGTLSAFPVPELSVYSRWRRIGTAEFAAFAYDAKTGRPVAFAGPEGGQRDLKQTNILTVFKFGSRIEKPGVIPKS